MDCHLGDIDVHYEVLGEGTPLLVLHGSVGDHLYWQQTLEPVFEGRDGWKRIYVDLPGHGKTASPDWLVSEAQVLDVLLRFIDQVLPGERFAVAGFSWGGHLARAILHKRRPDIDGVLLIAPSIGGTDALPERTVLYADAAAMADAEPWIRGVLEGVAVVHDRDAIDRVRSGQAAFEAGAQDDPAFAARLEYDLAFTPDDLVEPFVRPSLIVLGRQDNLAGYRRAWTLIEQFPRATFAVLDRAGHLVAGIEQVAVSRALIRDWLNRVEEAAPRL